MPLMAKPGKKIGFRLVTHVYVHGIMYGEAWPKNGDGGEWEEIVLGCISVRSVHHHQWRQTSIEVYLGNAWMRGMIIHFEPQSNFSPFFWVKRICDMDECYCDLRIRCFTA